MKIYHSIEQFPSEIKSVLTIGTFDGVHKGHKYVLNRLNELAKKEGGESVLLTFYPHPRHVLYPENQQLKLLNTIEEKIEKLKDTGLQHFIIHKFTKEFSRTKSVNFIRDLLVNKLQMKRMVVGHDHHFGRNREGSYDELKELSELYNFQLEQIPAQNEEGIVLSSTKIRNLIVKGEVSKAGSFLGYSYFIKGKVVKGNKLGRTIDYPTANILVENEWKLLPADGVYVVNIYVNNNHYSGMLNIGKKPTLENKSHSIEVHIFDFSEDIYDKEIKVEFLKKIRDEKKFDSLLALQKQLQIDENNCKKYLNIL